MACWSCYLQVKPTNEDKKSFITPDLSSIIQSAIVDEEEEEKLRQESIRKFELVDKKAQPKTRRAFESIDRVALQTYGISPTDWNQLKQNKTASQALQALYEIPTSNVGNRENILFARYLTRLFNTPAYAGVLESHILSSLFNIPISIVALGPFGTMAIRSGDPRWTEPTETYNTSTNHVYLAFSDGQTSLTNHYDLLDEVVSQFRSQENATAMIQSRQSRWDMNKATLNTIMSQYDNLLVGEIKLHLPQIESQVHYTSVFSKVEKKEDDKNPSTLSPPPTIPIPTTVTEMITENDVLDMMSDMKNQFNSIESSLQTSSSSPSSSIVVTPDPFIVEYEKPVTVSDKEAKEYQDWEFGTLSTQVWSDNYTATVYPYMPPIINKRWGLNDRTLVQKSS